MCYQQQVPVKQRSTNVSSSKPPPPPLFPPRALFLFFLRLPLHRRTLPRTRFSIIDSLTRQDILLSDTRVRYKPSRGREREAERDGIPERVALVGVVSRSINLPRSRPLINNSLFAASYYVIVEIISSRCANYETSGIKTASFFRPNVLSANTPLHTRTLKS